MTPEEFMKLVSTYGLPTALAVFMVWNGMLNKKEPTGGGQVMGELITKIDAISEKVDELKNVPVRLAIVETKIEALIK